MKKVKSRQPVHHLGELSPRFPQSPSAGADGAEACSSLMRTSLQTGDYSARGRGRAGSQYKYYMGQQLTGR